MTRLQQPGPTKNASRPDDRSAQPPTRFSEEPDFVGNCTFLEWDACGPELPADLDANTFDGICAIEVLEHMENPLAALRNFDRLLRPNGLLIVSTPNVTHPWSRLRFLVKGAPIYFDRLMYEQTGHRCILPDWLLELHVRAAGFENIRTSYAGSLGLTPLSRAAELAVRLVSSVTGLMPSPRTDDGNVTFVIARRG